MGRTRLRRSRPSATASRPTCSPSPRGSPAASPPARVLVDRRARGRRSRIGDLGTTFGGGPLACALIEAVARRDRGRGAARRACARSRAQIREHLPASARWPPSRGAGFLARPAHRAAGEGGRSASSCARGILAGTSADPHVVRLLPPLVLEARARRAARRRARGAAGVSVAGREAASSIARRARAARRSRDLLALAARLERAARAARARRQGAGAAVLQPVAAHARLDAGGDGAARRQLVRDLARAGDAGSSRPATAW